MGEFGLIERIQNKLSFSHQDILKSIGDDASVTKIQRERVLLSTCDSLIEDIHFDLRSITAYELGKKSLAVNISDIAAMGGYPRFFLTSLGIPSKVSTEFIDDFLDGLHEMAQSFQTYAIGGDTSLSPEKLVINITVLGEALPDSVVYRNNARIGHQIFVTGTLGDSALGLKILTKRKIRSRVEKRFADLVERHTSPTPRALQGQLIAENSIASAMIDISDGLLSDLGHICKQSNVGAKIWLNKLPLSQAFQRFASEFTDSPIDLPLSGGEDYELLFTMHKEKMELLEEIKSRFQTRVTHIGEIVKKEEGITVLDEKDKEYEVKKSGFDHFL